MLQQSAKLCESRDAALHHGRVSATDGKLFGVSFAGGHARARVAAGCLLQPCVGDKVLVSVAEDETYILNVLERRDTDAPADLQFEGSVRLTARGGSIELRADEGVDISAAAHLWLSAPQAQLGFGSAALTAAELDMTGMRLHSTWRQVSESAVRSRRTAERAEEYYGEAVEVVARHQEIRARSQRLHIDTDWSVRTDNATIRAENHARVDGKRVHLG